MASSTEWERMTIPERFQSLFERVETLESRILQLEGGARADKLDVRCPRCQQLFRQVTVELATEIRKSFCAVCRLQPTETL